MHDLLPLIILVPLLLVIGGLILGFVRAHHAFKLRQLAYQAEIAAIERGADPMAQRLSAGEPLGVSAERTGGDPHAFWFTFGIMALFVGAGIGLFLLLVAPHDQAWYIGIVPIFSGLGSIACGVFLEKRARRR